MRTAVRKPETPRRQSAPRSNERRLVTQHPRRRFLHLAVGAAVVLAVSRAARAQAYPTRPVTMIADDSFRRKRPWRIPKIAPTLSDSHAAFGSPAGRYRPRRRGSVCLPRSAAVSLLNGGGP
jgi:hypothetical protein